MIRTIEKHAKIRWHLILAASILLFFLFCSTAAAEEDIEKINHPTSFPIKNIEIAGLRSISARELLYLLDLERGHPLDEKSLRIGIKRAFLKGIFKDIIVQSLDTDRTSIRIIVKEKEIIKNISIEGNDHFSNRLIRKNLSVHKGERLNERKLENSVADLNAFLRKKGYPDCKVTYSIKELKNNRISISLTVLEGSPIIIKEIRITKGFEKDVDRRLDLGPGDVFDRVSIDASIDKITADFKNSGHVEANISYSFQNGVLDIDVTPGRKLKVEFEGNSSISTRSLNKEIPFFELDEFSDDLLEETVTRIINVYHSDGFPDAQIAPVVSSKDNDISIKFYVHEGDRYKIQKISFDGSSLPSKELKTVIQSQVHEYYNPDAIPDDNDSLRDLYHSLGYIHVELQEPDVEIKGTEVSITFRIIQGIQVLVSSIEIKGNKDMSAEEIMKEIPLKKGNPYNEVDILNSRIKIQDLYRKKGYLNAAVTIEREISESKAGIIFQIQEGEEFRFGKNVVIGNEDTKREVITRSLLHKENEAFDYPVLLKERQRLYRTGLFSGIDIAPWEKFNHSRDVLYKVEEGNAGAFEFGIGYAEYEKLRGFFDVSYKNLFGMNREIGFRTEASTLDKRFVLSYFDPWIFNQELALKVQFIREFRKEINIDNGETNYRVNKYTATAGLEKKLSDRIKGEIYYELSSVKTFDVKPDIILTREDTGTLLISGIKPGLIYDSRSNPVDPRDGVLAGLTYKVATALLFSETDFHKIQMYINKYQGLTKWLVLAVSARAGSAWGFGNTSELPLVERFFLGGRTTVRGYEQDTLGPKGADGTPTGGNAFLMGNLELRFDVWKGLGFVTFLDGGNVWHKSEQISPGQLKYTTGVGLRYNTPVGPLRVDYGFKLNRQTGESSGAVHFSVGHAF